MGMPFFHATLRRHLPSINRHGLGARGHGQNWPGCAAGAYLSTHPAVCIAVMLEHYIQFGEAGSVPSEHLKEICILVIDDSRVEVSRLAQDPQSERSDSLIYAGVIDVAGMPVIDVETALAFEAVEDYPGAIHC